MPNARQSRTFSPSPPSSPSFCFTDSSPASSPNLDPINLDSPPPLALTHPLAASAKATRSPKLHEKKRVAPLTPLETFCSKRSRYTRSYEEDEYLHKDFGADASTRSDSPTHSEKDIWEDAIAKVVDSGHGTIELSGQQLSYIPREISELGHFVAIPETSEHANANTASSAHTNGRMFRRATTAPASTTFLSRPSFSERTRSIVDSSFGLEREELKFFLAGNQIRTLPAELFRLERLTVLSIRGNQLTYLPPSIHYLTNLRELHISNNRLTYLPAEILQMSLKQITLHPNPFLSEPPLDGSARETHHRSSSRMIRGDRRVVSPTLTTLPQVIPLTELCFRVLLSSSSQNSEFGEETNLTSVYGSSLPPDPSPYGYGIPEPLQEIMSSCVPNSVAEPNGHCKRKPKQRSLKADEVVSGIGICPSPRHQRGRVYGKSVFVKHAEERYTWEDIIGGVPAGGRVACRWRGCLWGCLDFLAEGEGGSDEVQGQERKWVGVEMGEEDEMEVVQLVTLGDRPLSMDFDE